jgi:hypothetical protein
MEHGKEDIHHNPDIREEAFQKSPKSLMKIDMDDREVRGKFFSYLLPCSFIHKANTKQ